MNIDIIKNYVSNINICYLVCNLLLLVVFNLFLKTKEIKLTKRAIVNILALFISVITFIYMSGIIDGIFDLKYLSVRYYLVLIIGVNFITLITINKKFRFFYSVLNYTLYILSTIIFVACFFIVLGNNIESLYLMEIDNAIILMNVSFVIFIIYLIIFSIIYIGYYLFKPKEVIIRKEEVKTKKASTLSRDELFNLSDKNNFTINGVDCSIIFEDSNQDNILKNYLILSDDIDAKMVNGFTLRENKLLRSICMKLNVNSLSRIDIGNINILNKISIEEYTFLKSIMSDM